MLIGDKMKTIKRILLIIIMLGVLGVMLFAGFGYMHYKDVLEKKSIEEKISEIQSMESYVSLNDISPYMIQATISIEDRRFYDHGGVDYWSLTRAFASNLFAKGIVGGGSTITQQLAKNLFFTYEPSYIRKASELFMAYDLESKLSKEAILELYLNIINYGDNHIGIKQASEGYFEKDAKDLTLDEATLLAGLPQSPSNYQLSNHKEQAIIRQKQVLKAMVRDDHISQKQMDVIVKKH